MKRSTFTERQIAYALTQAEPSTPVEEGWRKMGILDATLFNWKKKYGGLGPSEVQRLKQLEEENDALFNGQRLRCRYRLNGFAAARL